MNNSAKHASPPSMTEDNANERHKHISVEKEKQWDLITSSNRHGFLWLVVAFVLLFLAVISTTNYYELRHASEQRTEKSLLQNQTYEPNSKFNKPDFASESSSYSEGTAVQSDAISPNPLHK